MQMNWKSTSIIAGVSVAVLILFLAATARYIDEHQVGVFVSGGEPREVRDGGWQFVLPTVSNIVTIPTTVQSRKIEEISAGTKDNYALVDSELSISYRIDPHPDRILHLYKEMPNFDAEIRNEAEDALKAVTGQIEMADVPQMREEIGERVRANLQSRFEDDYGITIQSTDLSYYGWDSHAAETLGAMQQAESERERAERELEREKLVSERREETARSEADAEREKARGEADALRAKNQAEIEAERERAKAEAEAEKLKGEAEAQRLRAVAEAIQENPELIDYQRTLQWDGAMPLYSGDSDHRINLPGDID